MDTLNTFSLRTVPGYVNLLRRATNTATVSLWSKDSTALYTSTTRKGDYFRGEVPFNNATGAMWLTITNVAALSNFTGADIVTNVAGSMLLAKTPESFTYDADGNLTSDSLWTNVWNGENRRTVIESSSDAPSPSRVKEQWTFLPDGRWIERIVSTWNPSTLNYQPSTTNRFVWDNQVLLAVLDHTNGVVVSFMRGLDLSGSIQGAGGVGGVLAGNFYTNSQLLASSFYCYDGNGNVTALVNAATGKESARYEYAPFAEKLRETGPMAKLNPIRFSTQYAEDVTGDTKYLFRDLVDGRWLNRDPINELGFKVSTLSRTRFNQNEEKSLYRFVGNNPLCYCDRLGKDLTGTVVGRVFPESWAVSGNPAGLDAGWYAVHCATHCWLSALRTQAGFDDGSNIALSGLHAVIWEWIEIANGDTDEWGYEPWYDRIVDVYANTYGSIIGMKRCAPPKCSAWYGWIGRVLRDADKARRCCDSACAALQPEFEGFATALRILGEIGGGGGEDTDDGSNN